MKLPAALKPARENTFLRLNLQQVTTTNNINNNKSLAALKPPVGYKNLLYYACSKPNRA
jgi:hypothetical protein